MWPAGFPLGEGCPIIKIRLRVLKAPTRPREVIRDSMMGASSTVDRPNMATVTPVISPLLFLKCFCSISMDRE